MVYRDLRRHPINYSGGGLSVVKFETSGRLRLINWRIAFPAHELRAPEQLIRKHT